MQVFGNLTKQNAYQSALNHLYNGYDRTSWDGCGLDDYDADEVWEEAERKFMIMYYNAVKAY